MEAAAIERLILKLSTDGDAKQVAGLLADAIALDDRIRRERYRFLAESQRLRERHIAEENDHEAKGRDIQCRCPHYEEQFYGDAAGGNDSFWECTACGRTRK